MNKRVEREINRLEKSKPLCKYYGIEEDENSKLMIDFINIVKTINMV